MGSKLNIMEQYFHVCLQIILDTSDIHIWHFLKNNLMQLKGSGMLKKSYRPKKKWKKTLETEGQGLHEVLDDRYQFRFQQ